VSIEDTERKEEMNKGYMYLLKCSDGTFYTGSTKDLEQRINEHQGSKDQVIIIKNERGANYTKARRPVKLVYYEEYERIDEAFYREKQVQNWSHEKKLALIEGQTEVLPKLAKKVFHKSVIPIQD
jgi:putative endonuclease